MYFIGKYILVLDRDTISIVPLELDYRSIMHILVKVLSNQDSGTRMVLIPVRVQICRLGWWREFDGGSEHLMATNLDAMLLD